MSVGSGLNLYYQDDLVTIYHGDCREWSGEADVLVTDPPYPNNAGWFDDSVETARVFLRGWDRDALVFWSELERPPVEVPLVAVHIWHRPNVNGRPYEAVYHFALDGRKRRSAVFSYGVFFPPHGYTGDLHPTRKPVPVMESILALAPGTILDPFMGGGPTLLAAKSLGRKAIGIEIEERYCEIAARRCSQEVLGLAV